MLRNTVKVLEDRLRDAEKRSREQQKNLERVMAKKEQLQLHSSLTENGQAIWKIKDFKASLVGLENGYELTSLPYFTGSFGHKFCLKLHPFKHLEHGKCLGLFFVVLESEYGNALEKNWPVGTVKISCRFLSQQGSSRHGKWKEVNLTRGYNKSYPSELSIVLDNLDGLVDDGSLYIEVKLENIKK